MSPQLGSFFSLDIDRERHARDDEEISILEDNRIRISKLNEISFDPSNEMVLKTEF